MLNFVVRAYKFKACLSKKLYQNWPFLVNILGKKIREMDKIEKKIMTQNKCNMLSGAVSIVDLRDSARILWIFISKNNFKHLISKSSPYNTVQNAVDTVI